MSLERLHKCEACGQNRFMQSTHIRDRFSGKEYSFSQCMVCTHIFLNPRPPVEDLILHYPPSYECYTSPAPGASIAYWHQNQEMKRRMEVVRSAYPGKGKLLDIGTGNAQFAIAAHTFGWEVLGIEPNWQAMQHSDLINDVEVIPVNFADFDPVGRTFDVITFWDVLEHLPFPEQTLKKAETMLSERGVIIFSIPNMRSFDRMLFRSTWIGWDPPRHLNLFTENSLRALTRNLNLEISLRVCISGGKGSFLLSLEILREKINAGPWVRRLYPLISACLLPYRRVSYLLTRGPIITYVLRKSN